MLPGFIQNTSTGGHQSDEKEIWHSAGTYYIHLERQRLCWLSIQAIAAIHLSNWTHIVYVDMKVSCEFSSDIPSRNIARNYRKKREQLWEYWLITWWFRKSISLFYLEMCSPALVHSFPPHHQHSKLRLGRWGTDHHLEYWRCIVSLLHSPWR